MIKFYNLPNTAPYIEFTSLYKKATQNKQKAIEAISISSWDTSNKEVNSRYVNLKHIHGDEWTFYTNYESQKMKEFLSHKQISGLFYWNSINVQIRIKALAYKSSSKTSDEHFAKRSRKKNALAISSMQSRQINSYADVVEKYNQTYQSIDKITKRPEYWGGISFKPYYFEFWKGHESRLNERRVYINKNDHWNDFVLEP